MPESTKPLVTALIVNRNSKDDLLLSLKMFFASADVPVEAVVVDNDSSDGSAAAVADEFPQVTVLGQSKDLGYGRAANIGLERCQGRFILLLSPRVRLDPQCVGRLADFLLTRPDAGAVGPKLTLPNGKRDPDARRAFPLPSTLFYQTVGLSKLFPKSARFGRQNMGHVSESDVHEMDAGTAACLMLRRSALDRVGFFDPRYFMFGEDLDLCYRLKLGGWKVFYLPSATAMHDVKRVAPALYAYYFGSATVLAAMGAQEANPQQYQQLYNIVQALAIGDGLPLPKVYVINDPSPNAFATGRDPNHAAVTVTTGLMQMMNREELEGVLAHEMSHVKNFDVRLLLVVTTMIGMAALIASVFWNSVGRMRVRGEGGLIVLAIGILFTLVAFVVGPLMQLALSRQRESLADVSGVELTRNPTGLISALQKIAQNDKPPERFNHAVAAMMIDNPEEHHGSFFARLFDTHPPIAERIAALQRIASVQQT